MPIQLFDDLLKRTILKNANTLSLSQNLAIAGRQKAHANYVINLLRAPNVVQIGAIVAAEQPNALESVKRIGAVLRFFLTLSPTDRALFITHFAYRASLVIGVPGYISRQKLWSGDDVPPPNLGGGRLPPRGRL